MTDLKPPFDGGYSIWFEAVEEDQRFLQHLVDDFANIFSTRRFTAHATLLGLPDKKGGDLSTVRGVCRRLAAVYNRIQVELVGVGVCDKHLQSVFLTMVPDFELDDLNKQARAALMQRDELIYMQHWSVLYGDIDRQERREAVQELIGKVGFPRMITINNIALVDVKGHPDEWKAVDRFPLCG